MAAAAYRAGERLYDATLGQWFSYDRKRNIVHTEILIPSTGKDSPWVKDRGALWNAVERSEKRVDAQLAREVEITLPRELSLEQQIALIRAFVQENYVDRGMVADISIHAPRAADGGKQPHAHVLLTLRELDSTTETGFARTKERMWNEDPTIARACAEARKRFNRTGLDEDREAMEAVESKRNINIWRKSWADHCNAALADAGSEARIDHRTLEKQGIFRFPQINLGIARHIEKAYDYLKERVTNWVAIKKRAMLYEEVKQYEGRDVVKLAEFLLHLTDMAESFAAQLKGDKPRDIPEVPYDR